MAKITIKDLEMIRDGYTDLRFKTKQINVIRRGFKSGLSMEQIAFYADPKFNSWQMSEIRYGFNNGLSMDQVSFYADPKFDWGQMREIRSGFMNGLSMEQVAFYADPKFDKYQMRFIKDGFNNGLSMEQVSIFANSMFISVDEVKDVLEISKIEQGLSLDELIAAAKRESKSVPDDGFHGPGGHDTPDSSDGR